MTSAKWFKELQNNSYGFVIKIDREILTVDTGIQKLTIFENPDLGRVLLLDDVIMLTEKDEFTYHEMMVHPALLAHPDPKDVLVIGGGDGGCIREIVKHNDVRRAVLCEIDPAVIEYSKKFLPFTACGFDSSRVHVHIGDGIQYVADHPASFDVVIVDSTDPVGIAEGLFQSPFYRGCLNALKPGGILVQQTESPFFDFKKWSGIFNEVKKAFSKVFVYGAAVPMYLSGYWTFVFASNHRDPWMDFSKARADALPGLRYYSAKLQQSAFQLPAFAELALETSLNAQKPENRP
jgi:spermidine synthase